MFVGSLPGAPTNLHDSPAVIPQSARRWYWHVWHVVRSLPCRRCRRPPKRWRAASAAEPSSARRWRPSSTSPLGRSRGGLALQAGCVARIGPILWPRGWTLPRSRQPQVSGGYGEVVELDDRPRRPAERPVHELRSGLDASDAGGVVGVVVGGRADPLAVDRRGDGGALHPDGHVVPCAGPERGDVPAGQYRHADALAVLQQLPRAGVGHVEDIATEIADFRPPVAEPAQDPRGGAGLGEQDAHADGVVPPAPVADDGIGKADVRMPVDRPLRRHLLQAVAGKATATRDEFERALLRRQQRRLVATVIGAERVAVWQRQRRRGGGDGRGALGLP